MVQIRLQIHRQSFNSMQTFLLVKTALITDHSLHIILFTVPFYPLAIGTQQGSTQPTNEVEF